MDKYQLLNDKKAHAELGGGKERIASQHRKGKLTARERVELLVDEGSFEEIGMFVEHRSKDFGLEKEIYLGDGVITGYATVNGRAITCFPKILRCLAVLYRKHMPRKL